jgi:hypothetical protein
VLADPELSVVVTMIEGEPALVRCLDALARQDQAPMLEVIVPYDAATAQIASLAQRYPQVRFLPLGEVAAQTANAFDQHERYDRGRAAGIAASKGALVALVEDRGAPRSDWARAMVAAHAAAGPEVAAIGGTVVHAAPGAMRAALFISDYGRYQPPVTEGEAEYLTDINICYRRAALDQVAELWGERFQEAAVNWALLAKGRKLLLSAAPVVLYARGPAPLGAILAERLHWGRVFGAQRAAHWSMGRALVGVAMSLLLPLVLLLRHVRLMAAKGAGPGAVLSTAIALIALLPAWSLGEAIGYLEGAGAKA